METGQNLYGVDTDAGEEVVLTIKQEEADGKVQQVVQLPTEV